MVPSAALASQQNVPTLQGQTLNIRKGPSGVAVNKAKVVTGDIVCANGIVHVIDRVLVPVLNVPSKTLVDIVAKRQRLQTLSSILTTDAFAPVLNLLQGEGPFTVFACTQYTTRHRQNTFIH